MVVLVLKKMLFKGGQCIGAISLLSSLGKGEKFRTLTATTTVTDNGQILIRKAHLTLISGELKKGKRLNHVFTHEYAL